MTLNLSLPHGSATGPAAAGAAIPGGPQDGGAGRFDNPERQLASIAHIITRAAEIHPERVAIDDLLNARVLTYAALDRRINRLARALAARGIRKGDIVAIMFFNEHPLVEALLACARIGAVAAPINVRLLPAEVAQYANFHGVRAVVTRAEFLDRFADVEAPVRIIRGAASPAEDYETLLEAEPDTVLPVATSLGDAFRLITTGGTTGMAKGVLHSHVGTYFTILANIAEFGIGRGWQTIMIAPGYHGAGMDWAMFPVLWRAGTLTFPADTSFNPARYLAEARARRTEFLLLVPAVVNAIHRAWDGVPLDFVRVVISTSAPTPAALRARLAEIFPNADLKAGSGISESLNMAVQGPGEFLAEPNAVGEPHLDTRLLIVDENDRPLPAGQAGQICLRGFNTALSYHRNAEAGAVTWRRLAGDPEGLEWCFTGDIGVRDANGRVSIVDRSKDVIITGGETVPSVEIEVAFADHPHLAECAAVGLEDERWGEAITLVVVKNAAAPADETLAEDLFAFGRTRLPSFKVPKQIVLVEALPRSHFGKVLKHDLRRRRFERVHSAEPARATRSARSA